MDTRMLYFPLFIRQTAMYVFLETAENFNSLSMISRLEYACIYFLCYWMILSTKTLIFPISLVDDDEGREDPSTTQSGSSSARQRNVI